MPISHAGPLPQPHPEVTLFAFDDHSLPFHYNLALHMVEGRKHPANPVLRPQPGAPDEFALEYGTVLWQDGRFRYWYLAWENPGPPFRVAYAESEDGVHWRRPNLNLVEFRGNRDNNLVALEPLDSPYVASLAGFPAVLYEPDERDPERRYKMALIVRAGQGELRDVDHEWKRWPAFMTAVSPDGYRWRLTADRPVVREGFEVGSLYKFGGAYYAGGQQLSPWVHLPGGREAGRVLVTYRSTDFVTWSPAKALSFVRAVQKSAPQGEAEEVHLGAGVWDRGNVLVGLYGQWHGAPLPFGPDIKVDLGLVVSNDGLHFREPMVDFKAVARGSWDAGFLVQSNGFGQVGDETWAWYGATPQPGNAYGLPCQVGIAVWRRDGLGYLTPKERWDEAVVVSCPIELGGEPAEVALNVDGLEQGAWARVEALDEHDRPLPGYGAAETVPIAASGLRQTARWLGRDGLPGDTAGPVRLRITLRSSGPHRPRLYAVYVGSSR